jgi:hypothetical protein
MDAVGLHHAGQQRDLLEEERLEGQLVLAGEVAEDLLETRRVARPVIGRNLHAEQQHPGAGILRGLDDFFEVAA